MKRNTALKIITGIIVMHYGSSLILDATAVTVIRHTTWSQPLDFDAIEKQLNTEEIVSIQPLKEYAHAHNKAFEADNNILLITFKNGLKAVFKPGEESIGEVIAYHASKSFHKYQLVPPTVYRQIGDEQGSVQLYIETSIDILKEKNKPFIGDYWNELDTEQIDFMKMFYFIFGQWDINSGNQLIIEKDGNYSLALIDNSGIANLQQVQYGDFAYIRCGYNDDANDSWDEPFPFNEPRQLKDCTFDELQKLFGNYMSKERIAKFWNRYKDKKMNYCFWRNALWIQYYKNDEEKSPLYIEQYSDELIEDITNISKEKLEEIWLGAKGILPKTLINHLISATLDRCKQVLKHATMNS